MISDFLESYSLYEVNVTAKTSVGEGPSVSELFKTQENGNYFYRFFIKVWPLIFRELFYVVIEVEIDFTSDL